MADCFPSAAEMSRLCHFHHKKGDGILAGWKDRYFSVNKEEFTKGKVVVEYKETRVAPVIGSIPLERIERVEAYNLLMHKMDPPSPELADYGWVIVAKPPNRTYILCAHAPEERDAWVSTLQRCMKYDISTCPSWVQK
eukprot:TRINITY_DN35387_c0_g1_i1.p1 TRINITY_DN35387_c0_g1~~TRINITY_DN35387_c0_g1_i1.p1  ORF type:complete len:156 (-),score=34.17 TRINITY_DN35387_c0_g1_i1:68-481(-)